MAILPLGHKAAQPQSPGEFVAGLGTSQVGVNRKLSPQYAALVGKLGVPAPGLTHNKFDVNWALVLTSVGSMGLSSARMAPGSSEVHSDGLQGAHLTL
jgi:hypothetical protein